MAMIVLSMLHDGRSRKDLAGHSVSTGRRVARLVRWVAVLPFLFVLLHPAAGGCDPSAVAAGDWCAAAPREGGSGGVIPGNYNYYLPYFLSNANYWTGVALRNGSPSAVAAVTVYSVSQAGSVLGSQSKTIPFRGQTAFMMTQGEGWVYVASDQPLTGLAFVAENAGAALMFDITFIPEIARTLHVPHVAQDATWDTAVYVCNPNASETVFYLTFVLSDGTVIPSMQYTLPANGSGVYPLSELVGGVDRTSGSVEIAASQGVAAFALYQNLKSGIKSYAGISAVAPDANAPFTNVFGMTFIRIPAGTFTMGSPEDETGRDSDETGHQVTLTKPFYLQTTEVTQGQWTAVMGSNPSHFDSCGDDCPVETVSPNDCQAFISQLNSLLGTTKYRLPTEAEWEYACRAGTATPFNTGECISTDQANYNGKDYSYADCPLGTFQEAPVPVTSFLPNAWGLYGMHGNVWECCQDRYGDYPSLPATDPDGPSDGSSFVRRGGGWDSSAKNCRSANRGWCEPNAKRDYNGLRVARDF